MNKFKRLPFLSFTILVYLQVSILSMSIALGSGDKEKEKGSIRKSGSFLDRITAGQKYITKTLSTTFSSESAIYHNYKNQVESHIIKVEKQLDTRVLFTNSGRPSSTEKDQTYYNNSKLILDNLKKNVLTELKNVKSDANIKDTDKSSRYNKIYKKFKKQATIAIAIDYRVERDQNINSDLEIFNNKCKEYIVKSRGRLKTKVLEIQNVSTIPNPEERIAYYNMLLHNKQLENIQDNTIKLATAEYKTNHNYDALNTMYKGFKKQVNNTMSYRFNHRIDNAASNYDDNQSSNSSQNIATPRVPRNPRQHRSSKQLLNNAFYDILDNKKAEAKKEMPAARLKVKDTTFNNFMKENSEAIAKRLEPNKDHPIWLFLENIRLKEENGVVPEELATLWTEWVREYTKAENWEKVTKKPHEINKILSNILSDRYKESHTKEDIIISSSSDDINKKLFNSPASAATGFLSLVNWGNEEIYPSDAESNDTTYTNENSIEVEADLARIFSDDNGSMIEKKSSRRQLNFVSKVGEQEDDTKNSANSFASNYQRQAGEKVDIEDIAQVDHIEKLYGNLDTSQNISRINQEKNNSNSSMVDNDFINPQYTNNTTAHINAVVIVKDGFHPEHPTINDTNTKFQRHKTLIKRPKSNVQPTAVPPAPPPIEGLLVVQQQSNAAVPPLPPSTDLLSNGSGAGTQDLRKDMLNQIAQGIKLKKTGQLETAVLLPSNNPPPAPPSTDLLSNGSGAGKPNEGSNYKEEKEIVDKILSLAKDNSLANLVDTTRYTDKIKELKQTGSELQLKFNQTNKIIDDQKSLYTATVAQLIRNLSEDKAVPEDRIDAYKDIMYNRGGLAQDAKAKSVVEQVSRTKGSRQFFVAISGVQDTISRHQYEASQFDRKSQAIQAEIGIIEKKLKLANDPVEQQFDEVNKIINSILFDNSKCDLERGDARLVILGLSRIIRKGDPTKELYDIIRTHKEKINHFLSNGKQLTLEEIKKEYEDKLQAKEHEIQEQRKTINKYRNEYTPKKSNNSNAQELKSGKGDNSTDALHQSLLIDSLDLADTSKLRTKVQVKRKLLSTTFNGTQDSMQVSNTAVAQQMVNSLQRNSQSLSSIPYQNNTISTEGLVVYEDLKVKDPDALLAKKVADDQQENIDVSVMETNAPLPNGSINEPKMPLYHPISSSKSSYSPPRTKLAKQEHLSTNIAGPTFRKQSSISAVNPNMDSNKLPEQMVAAQYLPSTPNLLASSLTSITNIIPPKASYNNQPHNYLVQQTLRTVAKRTDNPSIMMQSQSNKGFNQCNTSALVINSESPYYEKIASVFNSIPKDSKSLIQITVGGTDFAVAFKDKAFYIIQSSNSINATELLQHTFAERLIENYSEIKQIEWSVETPSIVSATSDNPNISFLNQGSQVLINPTSKTINLRQETNARDLAGIGSKVSKPVISNIQSSVRVINNQLDNFSTIGANSANQNLAQQGSRTQNSNKNNSTQVTFAIELATANADVNNQQIDKNQTRVSLYENFSAGASNNHTELEPKGVTVSPAETVTKVGESATAPPTVPTVAPHVVLSPRSPAFLVTSPAGYVVPVEPLVGAEVTDSVGAAVDDILAKPEEVGFDNGFGAGVFEDDRIETNLPTSTVTSATSTEVLAPTSPAASVPTTNTTSAVAPILLAPSTSSSPTKETILNHMEESNSNAKELENTIILFKAESGSEASKLVIDASNIPTLSSATEALKKNIEVSTGIQEIVTSNIRQVSNSLSNRIRSIAYSSSTNIFSFQGVAAGDTDSLPAQAQYGAWFMPLYGFAEQKARINNLGYKVKSVGGIIGVDTSFNNDLSIIGAALSFINSNIKHKNSYADKTKTDSLIFSLYGKHNITKSLFIQSLVSYSSTKVSRQEERIFSLVNQIANANYKSNLCSAELLLGYDIKLGNKLLFTPFIGISYLQAKEEAYRERGLSFANRVVLANKSDRTDSIVGASLSTNIKTNKATVIISEIHGSFSKFIKGKAGKILTKIDGMNEPFVDIPGSIKTIANLGGNLTIKSGMLEYGLGYDMQLTKKYIGHQGSLKLRVNF